MITISEVSKSYKRATGERVPVFEDLNLSIDTAERFALLGPKLTGKTTFVRMLTGFEPPDRGSIARHCEVSYPIGSSSILSSNMTGKENISFISRVFGCDPSEITAFVEEYAEIGSAINREVAVYSPEEKGRLAFVLSYAIPFDFYIIDGNVGRGSELFRKKCGALLEARLEESGMLLATASHSLAKAYCKKAFVISDRRLLYFDNIEEGVDRFLHEKKNL